MSLSNPPPSWGREELALAKLALKRSMGMNISKCSRPQLIALIHSKEAELQQARGVVCLRVVCGCSGDG